MDLTQKGAACPEVFFYGKQYKVRYGRDHTHQAGYGPGPQLREDQNPGKLVLATCWSIPGRPESHKSGPGHVLGLTVLARVAPPNRKIPYICTELWKIISLEKLTGLAKC